MKARTPVVILFAALLLAVCGGNGLRRFALVPVASADTCSVVGGGTANTAPGSCAVVDGGYSNDASRNYAVVTLNSPNVKDDEIGVTRHEMSASQGALVSLK